MLVEGRTDLERKQLSASVLIRFLASFLQNGSRRLAVQEDCDHNALCDMVVLSNGPEVCTSKRGRKTSQCII